MSCSGQARNPSAILKCFPFIPHTELLSGTDYTELSPNPVSLPFFLYTITMTVFPGRGPFSFTYLRKDSLALLCLQNEIQAGLTQPCLSQWLCVCCSSLQERSSCPWADPSLCPDTGSTATSSLLGSASQFTPTVVRSTVYSNYCSLPSDRELPVHLCVPNARLDPDYLQVYRLEGCHM